NSFVDTVESRERLDYLYCLTVADIAAVGPQVWTVWKGSLLTELYHSASQVLLGDMPTSKNEMARLQQQREAALALIESSERAQAEAKLLQLPANMLRHLSNERLAMIAQFLLTCSQQDGVETHIDQQHGGTLILVHSRSRDGLFAALASVIHSCRVSVISAQGFDLDDGYIIDIFLIQNMDGSIPQEQSDLAKLRNRINKILSSEQLPVHHPLTDWKVHILMRQVTPKVRLLPQASTHYTVVEVTAADRPGILADLSAAINSCKMHIHGTQISTFGEQVVDVFFLERMGGAPLDEESRQQLFTALYAVITLPNEPTDAT
ncbi:MAG: hypothetical protein Q9M13_08700, partial [Mariprofundales bacterium]|nr:hypothetical protein [Mariprofundales bacterium]